VKLCMGDSADGIGCSQAFGNNVSQLVVLSIQPVTDWAVAAAEIML
jgi:hypothetical protein